MDSVEFEGGQELAERISEILERDSRRYSGFRETEGGS